MHWRREDTVLSVERERAQMDIDLEKYSHHTECFHDIINC